MVPQCRHHRFRLYLFVASRRPRRWTELGYSYNDRLFHLLPHITQEGPSQFS